MKRIVIFVLMFIISLGSSAQTVVIDKEIQIGQSSNASQAGAIRFNGTDFEGFDGQEWRSFTQLNTSDSPVWGQPIICSLEDDKLTAPFPSSSDYFGYSVSISGSIAVIGAHLDDDAGTDAGCAYVFELIGGIWTQTAKLTASDAANNQWLGYAVAISGDVIVAGAYRDGGDQGAAYVYERPMGGWINMTETGKLTASDGTGGDKLGLSVSISGDVIVCGASEDDDNGTNSGAAYVFEKPMGGWGTMTETAKLTPSDGNGSDLFGFSVSISNTTILVGAYFHDSGETDAGAAYIFEEPMEGWASATEDAKLTASDRSDNDWFGYAVAINGDDAIVGAYGDNSEAGSAYIFTKSGANWTTTSDATKVESEVSLGTDRFGYSVAISNGVAVVGAPYMDNPNVDQGSAYLIQKRDGTWNNSLGTFTLKASDGVTDDRAGWSVAVSGNTIFSGAYSSTGFDFGAVYVYSQK
ncbi:MAG: FG-GAP repeat protein [Bacteroidota bacterium]